MPQRTVSVLPNCNDDSRYRVSGRDSLGRRAWLCLPAVEEGFHEGIALHGEDNPAKSHPPCAEGISIVQRSFAPQLKARNRVEH